MSGQRPILILPASAGAGHVVAAEALREQFARLAPGAPCEVHDVLSSALQWFRRAYAGGYLDIVNHVPAAMGMIYDLADNRAGSTRGGLVSALQLLASRGTLRHIVARRPRLIVCTHFLAAELVAHLRRTGRLACRSATVVTDFATHRVWAERPCDRFYVAAADGRADLAALGVPPQAVRVTGIPVRAGFGERHDAAELRRRLRIDERPLVLLLCGGFGVGPTERLFRELVGLGSRVQLVAITGRNARLAARLQAVSKNLPAGEREPASRGAGGVRVLGYSDRIHLWMQAARLVVTKSGGLTAAEALACGVPLVIIHPIPGQEERNSDYLLENGAAIRVSHPRILRHRVAALLEDAPRLGALRAGAARIGRPRAAEAIVSDLLELLDAAGGGGAVASGGRQAGPAAAGSGQPEPAAVGGYNSQRAGG